MKTHWALDGRVALLRPHGNLLGGEETDVLVAAAKDLVARGNRALLLDLAEVPFVVSLGLSAFVRIQKAYAEAGGVVRICNLSRRVHQLFEIVKFHLLFDVHDSEQEALTAFARDLSATPATRPVPPPGPSATSSRDETAREGAADR